MYICHRCNEKFDDKFKLLEHWKVTATTIPCDYICIECGTKLQNNRAFYRHKSSGCTYKPRDKTLDLMLENYLILECTTSNVLSVPTMTNSNIEADLIDEKSCVIVNEVQNQKQDNYIQDNSTHIHNGDVNNININIGKLVVTPHTQEMKIDKKELLGDIMEKILFRMDIGASGKANWSTLAFTDSFHQMFEHIYANKDRPEHQNILLKDPETRQLQIFDGEQFVDDKLTTEERMLKVLHFIGDGLKWMVENCETYTPEFKKEKKEQIGRVLIGIPKFKISYRAMFDNMFDSLKNVREEILNRDDEIECIDKV